MVKVIGNADDFKKEVLDVPGPVFVDFFATWCGPCKQLGPMLENQIAPEYEGKMPFYKVDIDALSDVSSKYRIMSVPTMKIFKDGEPIKTIVGLMPPAELNKQIEEAIG